MQSLSNGEVTVSYFNSMCSMPRHLSLPALVTAVVLFTVTLSAQAITPWIEPSNVNVKSFGAKGNAVADDTAAIQAAINSFGSSKCGTVFIPAGTYNVSSTILVASRQGCRIIGNGHGQTNNLSPTTIKWTGAGNGTVVSFSDCIMCYATGFLIEGNNSAGKGLEYTSATGSSQTSLFEDLGIINVTGTPGDAIYCGSSTGRQVDTSTFRNITTSNSVYGIFQEGTNTLQILYEKMNIQQITTSFLDLEGGGMSTQGNTYLGPFSTTGINFFQIANFASYAFFHDDYMEGGATGVTVFNMPGVLNTAGPRVSIQNGSYSDAIAGNTWINYTQNGWLQLLGNRWSGVSGLAFIFSPLGTSGQGRWGHLSFVGNWYNNAPVFTFTQPYSLTGLDHTVYTGASSTDSLESVQDTALQTIYSAAGTRSTSTHTVKDTCTLGTSCSVTLAGSAAFTNSGTYDCWARDATTPANAVTIARSSGSVVTFTGTGTDVINFLCTGN